tara:strand:+ start:1083 stop:1505 length:423 start_codon:yes stop_codon:yes gene_type:complete
MASKRERILAALKTTLAGTTGVGTRIYRSRAEPTTRAESPLIIVEWSSDQPDIRGTTGHIDWTLRVRIVVISRGKNPDNLADGTIESLHSKLLADPTIGGLAIDIRPSTTTFDVMEADQPAGVIVCEFEIDYRTSYASLA